MAKPPSSRASVSGSFMLCARTMMPEARKSDAVSGARTLMCPVGDAVAQEIFSGIFDSDATSGESERAASGGFKELFLRIGASQCQCRVCGQVRVRSGGVPKTCSLPFVARSNGIITRTFKVMEEAFTLFSFSSRSDWAMVAGTITSQSDGANGKLKLKWLRTESTFKVMGECLRSRAPLPP